jgi:WD40 repeat protein
MAKQKDQNTQAFLQDLPGYNPEPANGVRVGESPVQGLTLKRILGRHGNWINRIAWSPDGRLLASPSYDRTIRIWDAAQGKCVAVLEGHESVVFSVTWSPDGQRLASCSADETTRIWNTKTWKKLTVLGKYESEVLTVVWSPDGQ